MNDNNILLLLLVVHGLYTANNDFLVVNKTKVTGVCFTRKYYSFYFIIKNIYFIQRVCEIY